MKKTSYLFASSIICVTAFIAMMLVVSDRAQAASGLTISYLRCEYKVDPLGIDVKDPRLSWIVSSETRGQRQSAYQILVSGSKESLAKNKGEMWDTGKVASDETAQIAYDGSPLQSTRPYFWKVRVWDANGIASEWSKPAIWSMGFLNSEWQASWINGKDISFSKEELKKQQLNADLRKMSRRSGTKTYKPCPYLRKEFSAAKGIKRATVYVSALGFYELYINGKRVGNDYFTPGWTDFKKRVYYLTYDVTSLLNAGGENAIGAILSDGWYAGNVGGKGQHIYGDKLGLLAQLNIEYNDGSERIVSTDGSWKTATGPIIEADMQDGEFYDARLELDAWNKPGYNDSAWISATAADKYSGLVQPYPGIPVRKTMEIKPLKITEPKPGVFIFHMGQNFAGAARLKVKGKKGDKVVLRFGEMLNSDGTLYTTNLRGARVIDTYILKGTGEEIWEPRFTFHGFQYVEATGYPGKPKLDAITGIVMHSDLKVTGSVTTSSALVNKLISNTMWGQRSNYFEVPTDCPQRDERLGWMGDAQVFVRTATYNMDVAPFFTKWMVDVEDAQTAEGGYTDVAPDVLGGRSTAAWGDAGVICPWNILRAYGDKRMIDKHYASMRKWVDFLKQRSPGYLSPPLGGYGDWLNVKDHTDQGLISTAYYARSVSVLADMAKATGRTSDAESLRKLFGNIKKAYRMYYVANDGKVMNESQTSYLLSLHFDLLPDSMRQRVAELLVDRIKARDWSLSTGFVGGGMLLPTLTEIGRTDVAYRLLQNRKYPSWGYSIDQGATTIWERWNSYTKEDGFGDPGMNSFNHYAYGSVGEWIYGVLAGIDTDTPGFKHLVIHPRPGKGITFAKAHYDSIRGRIATDWKLKGKDFILSVSIPANTTATVFIPAKEAGKVTEGGRPADKSKGIKFLRFENGEAVYEIQSGKYSFASKGVTVE